MGKGKKSKEGQREDWRDVRRKVIERGNRRVDGGRSGKWRLMEDEGK